MRYKSDKKKIKTRVFFKDCVIVSNKAKVNQNKIDKLIIRLIENKISDRESDILKEWLQDEAHLEYFNDFIEINYLIVSKSSFDYKPSLENIKTAFNKRKNKITYLYKYAAAILIFVSAGYFFLTKDNSQITEPIIVNNNIKAGTDKATLTLEDGTEVILEKGENYIADNVSSNGEEIEYNSASNSKQEIAYNYLTIPRGGQYFVKLSDGTQVWLNSESKLKYPVNFIEGKTREVELVYGEAYFDVSPSTNHKGSEFKVASEEQMIKVLGTEFNVKAYRDDSNIYTTLVEGSIALNNTLEGTILTPNQQALLNKETQKIEVKTVDATKETLWRSGVFSFRGTSLREVTKVLSRWYDVDFIIKDETLYDITFKGVLGKDQNIEDVLNTIITSRKLSNYEINDKIITIE